MQQRVYGSQSLKYSASGPLQKKVLTFDVGARNYHWEKEMGEYGKDETSFLWRAQDSIYQKKKKKEE